MNKYMTTRIILPLTIPAIIVLAAVSRVAAMDFPVVSDDQVATIVYLPEAPALDSIAAHLLAGDIGGVTGHTPVVTTNPDNAGEWVILIGNINAPLVRKFLGDGSTLIDSIAGKWECYLQKVVSSPTPDVQKALVIAGSDRRGTAYGVFDITERIGVSPWYWWADVPVSRRAELVLRQEDFVSSPPSVKYRGIFLNDEDWGLQPWAAKTFEPTTGDIGPHTYAKIFELLLRLKANLIWPAMHNCTRAFFHYPANPEIADDYGIVVGTSHAEPMLRNNVDEWDEDSLGAFNYRTNRETVYRYWEQRARESAGLEAVYTMGMRGIHDSGMEGIESVGEAANLLESIIADQRGILREHVNENVEQVPQAFTPYKEVLTIYDHGMDLPEDITVVWPDDNYGYIRRMSDSNEQLRAGGAGVYYHASYWGRPHDYLWLSTTHPALIREEMVKAWDHGARKLWVLNVGDIKPLEYNMSMFLDMADNISPFQDSEFVRQHMYQWYAEIFGENSGRRIAEMKWQYYHLAFERRPEFMGWSQTEPITQTRRTGYNHFYYGDEAHRRIEQYDRLEKQVRAMRQEILPDLEAPFYQLVYYPVVGASYMNKKFLYLDKYHYYTRQGRVSAPRYYRLAKAAYDSIVAETNYYNTRLSDGKWNHMMSMRPRNLPVFYAPSKSLDTTAFPEKSGTFGILPEGYVTRDSTVDGRSTGPLHLPVFDLVGRQEHYIDIFLTGHGSVTWEASTSASWIHVSENQGTLTDEPGRREHRIRVSVDPQKMPEDSLYSGDILFTTPEKKSRVKVTADTRMSAATVDEGIFAETKGYLSIFAEHYTGKTGNDSSHWRMIEGLGHTGRSMQAMPYAASYSSDSTAQITYDFLTRTGGNPRVFVYGLPTHSPHKPYDVRLGISIDGGPVEIVNLQTKGRSDPWKQNVLRNAAIGTVRFPHLTPGHHTLVIHAVDPGVLLDRMIIDLGGYVKGYSVIPETRMGGRY